MTALHFYDPATRSKEVPCVVDAINLWAQVVAATFAADGGVTWPPDVDTRYIRGYVDGVANAMASVDGWCQDAADSTLWTDVARANGAGPGMNGAYKYARQGAWRDYITRAAAAVAEGNRS
jgi:hypothetical protein